MGNNESLPKKPSSQVGLPANGILRIYNQFPRCYMDINQMALQLPLIAEMGFNIVWINPIQETGKAKHPLSQDPLNYGRNAYQYSGSLYAAKDTEKFDDAFTTDKLHNKKNNIHDIIAIKNYTKTAIDLDLTPIYDLVLNQVSVDAEVYHKHPEWFIHPSAHFGPFCCDFNFKNSDVRPQIMKYLKKEIKKYIVDYGFLGVRVDAAKHLPYEVQKEIYSYIYKLCDKHHGVKPIIYAEIIAGPGELRRLYKEMQGLGITHVMNSLFQERFTKDYREIDKDGKGFWEKGPKGGNDVLAGLWLLRKMVHGDERDALGGTISFTGSHDYSSLYDAALSDQARSLVEKEWNYQERIPKFWEQFDEKIQMIKKLPLEQQAAYLKEKIAAMAFTSDAGLYLLSGDEYGHSGRKWVFDFYNPCENGKYTFKNGWGGQFNLCEFIAGVNKILSALPAPDTNFWAQHIVIPGKPDLMVVVRHNGGGYDKPPEIIITNLSNKEVELGLEDIKTIAEIAGRREQSNNDQQKAAMNCVMGSLALGNIFCLGKFRYDKSLIPDDNFKAIDVSIAEPLLVADIDGNEVHFEEHWVKPDGNCGFTSMGIEREQLVDCLMKLVDDPDACNFLADEIKNALLSEEVSSPMLNNPTWKKLYEQSHVYEQEIDAVIRKIKEKYSTKDFSEMTHTEIQEFLKMENPSEPLLVQLDGWLEKLKINQNYIDRYCRDPITVATYLNEYLNGLWLGYKSAKLFAQINNISLYIFQKDESGKLVLDKENSYISPSSTKVTYMVHTGGFTHFNLLTIAPQDKILQYQAALNKNQKSTTTHITGPSTNINHKFI